MVLPVGKKAVEYFQRRGIECLTEDFAEVADVSVGDCFQMANLLCREFKSGRFGHIELCFTTFVSMLSQQPEVVSMLPLKDIDKADPDKTADQRRNLIVYEPNSVEVFEAIVPEYLAGLIYGGVCEGLASELAARRTAMESATSNAEEMIEKLNLYYNRARQASITQEITEIVGGAEGL
jgi:F-type H+-transporting ATPase subunit gamma